MSVERYNARIAEPRWQQMWDSQKVFAARHDDTCPPYMIEASPLPAGRIDLNLVRDFTTWDATARYKRANGFDVRHPAEFDRVVALLKPIGVSMCWRREIAASGLGCNLHSRAGARAGNDDAGDVDPGDLIDTYGADAVRWFVLSDSPPGRNVVWSEDRIHGAWRFVHRLWRIINGAENFAQGAPLIRPPAFSESALEIRKASHRALAQIAENIEKLRFNICVACIYSFARTLEVAITHSPGAADPDLKFAAREAAETLVQLFHPMMPHLAEECWAALGRRSLVAAQGWPALEADLLLDRTVILPVHVNGRKQVNVAVARDARNGDIEVLVLALDEIRRALAGRTPKKVIIVPQRIINVVA